MKLPLSVLSLAMSLVVGAIVSTSSVNSSPSTRIHAPRIKAKNGYSLNWSGYAAETNFSTPQKYVVNDVVGSWTVPSVDCTKTAGNAYSSAWVGMDGYSNGTVEQTGTEQDCIGGQPQYYAWYEMYPKPSYKIPLTIIPNETISAEVKYIGNGQFRLTLNGYTTTQKSNKALRQSAEWIMEAPSGGSILPLADFGTIGYSGSNAALGSYTLNPISNYAYDPITMVASDGTTNKAVPSSLTNGTDFSVTWFHQ